MTHETVHPPMYTYNSIIDEQFQKHIVGIGHLPNYEHIEQFIGDYSDKKVILDGSFEASNITPKYDHILLASKQSANPRMIYTDSILWDVYSKDYVTQMNFNKDIEFLSFNGYPRWHRTHVMHHLETNNYFDRGEISYNPFNSPHNLDEENMHPDWINRSIVCDTNRRSTLYHGGHIEPDVFGQANINLVTETSATMAYDGIFVTEKSYRCFNYGMIPIIIGQPGIISHLESLGYDLYRDYIDHSYDSISNPMTRIKKALSSFDQAMKDKVKISNERLLKNNLHLKESALENKRYVNTMLGEYFG